MSSLVLLRYMSLSTIKIFKALSRKDNNVSTLILLLGYKIFHTVAIHECSLPQSTTCVWLQDIDFKAFYFYANVQSA